MSDVPTTPGPPQGPPSGPPAGPSHGPPSGPPQGPPAGPPPSPAQAYATPGPGPAATGGWLKPPVIVGILVVVLLLIVGIAVLASGGDEDKAAATGPGEVFLEPAGDSGQDPFTSSTAAPPPSSTVPLGQPVALGSSGVTAPPLGPAATPPAGSSAITSYQGGTPGLYGGTRDSRSCDSEKMIAFLAANPAKQQAWANAQGIGAAEVPAFIRGLTPVLLRGDTRVTNFGFRDDRPTPIQSVLQAGTAVLVDQYGEPQAKCNCGNPLNGPIATQTTPSYTGPRWAGFSPATVTVVVKNTTIINVITLIDITTGGPFGRPTGPNPGPDRVLPGPGGTTAPPTTSGPTTTSSTTSPPTTVSPTTLPPATFPSTTTTQVPTTTEGPTGDLVLVDVQQSITELPDSWTVNARGGTARIAIPGSEGNYSWTVPERIVPTGTAIDFGGAAVGNLNIRIGPRGEGIVFDTTDLDVDVTGGEGRKSAVITVPTPIAEVKLSYGMGFSVTVVYTYRR